MIHPVPGLFVLIAMFLVGPSRSGFLTIPVMIAGVVIALALRRSYRERTYVLLGLLMLMFSQSILLLILDLSRTLPRAPPPIHSGWELWPIFSAMFVVNSGVVAIGALVAGLAALFFEFGKSRFDMSKTLPELKFEPAPTDLKATVDKLAGVAGIDPPETVLVDSGIPSAFTIRANRTYSIGVSVGLLESLDATEVEACIAHEIAHLKNKDFRVRAIATLAKLALFARPPSYLIEPAIYRAREFLADETAAKMVGGPTSLISALSKLKESVTNTFPSTRSHMMICNLAETRRLHELLGKHPSLESRIRMLQEMKPD